jgi:hypothetical protein
MGTLQLADVPFQGDTLMYGFNAFLDPKTAAPLMKIDKIDVVGGAGDALQLSVDFEVMNPSNVAPSMGRLTLELWTSSGFKIGDVTVDNFKLDANKDMNAVTKFVSVPARYITPTVSPEAAAAGRLFMSTFVSHGSQNAEMRGTASGSPIPLLQPALAGFRTTSAVPGLPDKICIKTLMHVPSLFKIYDLPTELTARNPFSTSMRILGAHTEIYPCKTFLNDTVCKEFYKDSAGVYTPTPLNVVVPPLAQVVMPTATVKLNSIMSPEMIWTTFASLGGGSLIRIAGTMDFEVGSFKMTVDFNEHDIPITLKLIGNETDVSFV